MSNGHSGLSCSLMYMAEEYDPGVLRLARCPVVRLPSTRGWLWERARVAAKGRRSRRSRALRLAPTGWRRPTACSHPVPDAVRVAPSVATGARAQRTTRERHARNRLRYQTAGGAAALAAELEELEVSTLGSSSKLAMAGEHHSEQRCTCYGRRVRHRPAHLHRPRAAGPEARSTKRRRRQWRRSSTCSLWLRAELRRAVRARSIAAAVAQHGQRALGRRRSPRGHRRAAPKVRPRLSTARALRKRPRRLGAVERLRRRAAPAQSRRCQHAWP